MTEPALTARRYEGKLVLVTGGTGCIGTQLSRRLFACGAEVVVLGRHATKLGERVEFALGDARSGGGTGKPRDRCLVRAEASL